MTAISTAAIAMLLASAPGEPAPAAAPSTSSAPARAARQDAPISVGVIFDREGRSQVRAEYSLRWDFGDVKRLPDKTKSFLLEPWKPIDSLRRDLYRGSYVGFEGLRLRPERALSQWSPGLFASSGTAAGAANGEAAAVSRRRRLSLTPILDDVAQQLQEEISRSLIREGFNQALPQAREHGLREKKALLEDIKKLPEAWGKEP